MKYNATVVGLDDRFEELVVLDVLGNTITCFASVCPYPISVGESYPVKFDIQTFDELMFEEVDKGLPDQIILIEGFRHSITGEIRSGKLLSKGITFEDDDDFSDIAYLEGERVKISVDRLDAHFCE